MPSGTGSKTYFEEVQEKANQIWKREGEPDGRADIHWRQAESEFAREARIRTCAYLIWRKHGGSAAANWSAAENVELMNERRVVEVTAMGIWVEEGRPAGRALENWNAALRRLENHL